MTLAALRLMLCLIVLAAPSIWAIREDNTVKHEYLDIDAATKYEKKNKAQSKFEAAAIRKTTAGVCYSPFHNPQYPLSGGSAAGLDQAMKEDFSIMSRFFSVVRTYYSSYYGYPVAPAAAANGVRLYLGVYMTNEYWYENQVKDAIAAVKNYPGTIQAILVGNENIYPVGPFSPQDVSARISALRTRLQNEAGRTVPIGTVQRASDWLDTSRRAAFQALAANCDIVGVNIYPFFDNSYDSNLPLVILNAVWVKMASLYPVNKLRLTEVGYPTGGSPSWSAPNNIPSQANSKIFYDAFLNWNPSVGGGEAFWFMFFDRAPQDKSAQGELEKYFGFYSWNKKSKGGDYPVRLSALQQVKLEDATAPAFITIVSANVTTNVCRVRKVFSDL